MGLIYSHHVHSHHRKEYLRTHAMEVRLAGLVITTNVALSGDHNHNHNSHGQQQKQHNNGSDAAGRSGHNATTLHQRSLSRTDPTAVVQEHVRKLHWATYRSGLENIEGGFSSDRGWGCMHRSGQMLIAEAIRRMGRSLAPVEFVSSLEPNACFSFDRLCRIASSWKYPPPMWLSPSGLCYVLRDASRTCPHLRVSVCEYGQVPREFPTEEDGRLGTQKPDSSCLFLFPLRLGLDKIERHYEALLMRLFENEFVVGMVGGRPKSSYFFFGSLLPDGLFYLDPHTVQQRQTESSVESSCRWSGSVPIMSVRDLDPCLVLGCLVKGPSDMDRWRRSMLELNRWLPENSPLFVDGTVSTQPVADSQSHGKTASDVEDEDDDEFEML